jgi:hypothetical protein
MNTLINRDEFDSNTYIWASSGLPYDGGYANINAFLADGSVKVIKGLVIKINDNEYKAAILSATLNPLNMSQRSIICSPVFKSEYATVKYIADSWMINMDINNINYIELNQLIDNSNIINKFKF